MAGSDQGRKVETWWVCWWETQCVISLGVETPEGRSGFTHSACWDIVGMYFVMYRQRIWTECTLSCTEKGTVFISGRKWVSDYRYKYNTSLSRKRESEHWERAVSKLLLHHAFTRVSWRPNWDWHWKTHGRPPCGLQPWSELGCHVHVRVRPVFF